MARIVEEKTHDGVGGPLAIELPQNRGLVKALGGDKVVTLDDGGRFVLPKELFEAEPLPDAAEEPPVDEPELPLDEPPVEPPPADDLG